MNKNSYNLIKNALDASQLQQEMISSNIANINTPGYKANRVEFENLLSEASEGIQLKKTNEQHFSYNSMDDVEPLVSRRTNASVNDNGNNVDVDIEMTEEAANSLYYSALVTQLNAKYSLLNSAITK